ncbi:hypothetical protein SPSE_1949 [Staphylococcus pseudintermedius ED99]|nr:hypothetical protein SPSE_1949 [Staphylococcus pseudintermedius ED99]
MYKGYMYIIVPFLFFAILNTSVFHDTDIVRLSKMKSKHCNACF